MVYSRPYVLTVCVCINAFTKMLYTHLDTHTVSQLLCYMYLYIRMYCKRQKLSERKVSRFTGFYSNVRKPFAGLASSVLKVLQKTIAQKIHRENFHVSLKICENKTFLSANFYRLRYVHIQ